MITKSGQLYFLTMVWLVVGCFNATFAQAQPQIQIQHQAPTVLEKGTTHTFRFSAPGINPGAVQDAFLFYKSDGAVSYRQEKAGLTQNEFVVELPIPADSQGLLEYYLEVQLNNGERLTYPTGLDDRGPVRVELVEQRVAEKGQGTVSGIEYEVLSPDPNENLAASEVVIALALFFDDQEVDTANTSFQMFFDGEDITSQADASQYFYTFVPEDLEPGNHTVTLKMKNKSDQSSAEIVSWSFLVVDPMARAQQEAASSESFIPRGQVELTARNQSVAGGSNDILSGNVRLSGRKDNIRYSAYGLLTSQEDPRLQPQNRYGAELYIGNWLELKAGHVYPALSPLTIAGQRVEGVSTALRPFDGAINLEFVYGRMRRGISNLYESVQPELQSFNNVVVDTSYSLNFGGRGYGTFERDVIGGRLGFGRGRTFNFGINMLKVEDDTSSIDVIRDYNDLRLMKPELGANLTQADKEKLQQEPGLLSVNGNPLPKGNFVASSDLSFNIDDNNIRFRAEGAVSLLNEDISDGPLNSQAAEDLGFELDSGVENTLENLSWLIIINENMNALPLRFDVNATGSDAEFFFPTSLVGSESELSFNYFKNNLRLKYRWVGPDFNSLANSTVRKDIAGLTVTDRFRLLSNRIYVTLGYENLNDNVINYKDVTTNTVTYRGNVSWYPIKRELPRVSVGLRNRTRENGVDLFNPYLGSSLQDAAVRNYEVSGPDTLLISNARQTNTLQFNSSVSQEFELFGITHDASINYSILSTTDDVFAYGKAKSNSLSFRVNNHFRSMPLETHVGFSVNNTETLGGLTDIGIVGFDIGGSMFLLDDDLNINAGIAYTRNTSEVTTLRINENNTAMDDDNYYEPDPSSTTVSKSNSYIFNASGRYNIDRNHAFLVSLRFTNVTSSFSNTTIPNDRILQARYIFSF